MFGCISIENGFEQLGIQDLRHKLSQNNFFGRLENKVVGYSAGLFMVFGNWKESFYHEFLGSCVFEFAINNFNGIKFTVLKCFYGSLGAKLHRFKVQMLKYITEFPVYFIVVLQEMFIALFTIAPDNFIAFGGLRRIFIPFVGF